jgi:phosphate transport system substrate-binding protein
VVHRAAIVICLAALLAGCGVAPASPAPTQTPSAEPTTTPAAAASTAEPTAIYAGLRGLVMIDGSSTVFPITEGAALAFTEIAPDVDIRLGVSGTGGGFVKFCAGETVISNASRPINRAEREACAGSSISFIELPIAYDGLTVAIHPDNTWAQCLSTEDLRRLWSPDSDPPVTRWSQIRPDWPDEPVRLFGAGTDSGTFDYFTSAIVGEEGRSRADYTASEDDYLLAQGIAADPFALGFFGFAYYREYQDRLVAVAVDSGAGCVAPTDETIFLGQYQPLSRPIFIYVATEAVDRPEVRAFVDFYLMNAARLVHEARYVALPPRAASRSKTS